MELDTRHHDSDTDLGNSADCQSAHHDSDDQLSLDRLNSQQLPLTIPQTTNENTRPLRIMIVEDTPASQKLFKRILEPAGYQLYLADNGIAAIRDFSRVRPDLIIMDMQMPVLDGLQTTAILRVLDTHQPTIPIIATSARNVLLDRERFYSVGVDAFIPKPFDNQKLLGLIQQLIQQKHEQRRAVTDASTLSELMENTMQNTLNVNIINIAKALKRLGDDQQLMDDLIGFYFEDFPSLLEELRGAVLRHDWNRLQRAAHSFKGLAANFDAAPAVQAMQAIEQQSANHDPEKLSQLLADAEVEVARLTGALAVYRQQAQE